MVSKSQEILIIVIIIIIIIIVIMAWPRERIFLKFVYLVVDILFMKYLLEFLEEIPIM